MVSSTFHPDFQLNMNPLPLANRIDEVCDEFEAAWKSGHRPTIAQFLDETIAEHMPTLFAELVRIDMEYRALKGENPHLEEYESLYPQFSDVLTGLRRETPLAETIAIPVRPQKTLGRYELLHEAGGGGFGTVWKAWDTQLKRHVAFKVPRNALGGPEHERAFLREARAASELNHPHIVAVLESGSIDGTTFITSRFVEGVSLRKWMKARSMKDREKARICEQLAEAVEYAHQKGVIHRDLKPSNVLIDSRGEPHITDFGLATRRGDDATIGQSGAIIGTPAYMSPEQVRGKPRADHRSDVYSLGVTLYELLTGRQPYQGDQETVMLQVLHSEPEPPRQINEAIPEDLETICLKAMHKERESRYQTAAEMAADLRRYLNGEPIAARPVGRGHRLMNWVRRNSSRIAVIGSLIVALSAALSLVLNSGNSSAIPSADAARPMFFQTEPHGAELVVYRLDPRTGEPIPTERFEAPSRTPTTMMLPPGDYFVVAALDADENGRRRFQEVFRRVPKPDVQMSIASRIRGWAAYDRKTGVITLQPIKIPELDIEKGMVAISGTKQFLMGKPGSSTEPAHFRAVDDFLMDPTETTVSEAERSAKPNKFEIDRRYQAVPQDWSAAVGFLNAAAIAERLGKRLPYEHEYEYVATIAGKSAYPWGNDVHPPQDESPFGPVGQHAFDVRRTPGPIHGLCSNVAEWTMTYASLYPPTAGIPAIPASQADGQRVVRGIFRGKDTPATARPTDPRSRSFINIHELRPDIGFRCVRSQRPHLQSADFRATSGQ